MAMEWVKESRGQLTCIDWSNWMGREQHLDPYLIWADLSGAGGFAGRSPDDAGVDWKWPFIVELDNPDYPAPADAAVVAKLDCRKLPQGVPWILGCIEVSSAYRRSDANSPTQSVIDGKYITALASPQAVDLMLRSESIVRFQLGLPRIASTRPGSLVTNDRPASGVLPKVVVGVIDDGCAYLHPAFHDASGMTRVKYLWDQDPRRQAGGPPAGRWRQTEDFGYGAELTPPVLREAAALAHERGEATAYAMAEYGTWRLDDITPSSSPEGIDGERLPFECQRGGSHGTSVLDLAAGYPPPQRSLVSPQSHAARPARSQPNQMQMFARQLIEAAARASELTDAELSSLDAADQWDLVFVQLPSRTTADTSGGSLAVHVLDAVRYIQRRALALPYLGEAEPTRDEADRRANRLVLNLSYGALGGSHDGTSILEVALAKLLMRRDAPNANFLVVAAGNGHRAGAHIQAKVRRGEHKTLVWTVGPDNPLESYLEIWLPGHDVGGKQLDSPLTDITKLTITAPSGVRLAPMARVGQAWLLREPGSPASGPPAASVIFCRRVAQGLHGTMVLLSTRHTRPADVAARQTAGLHGDWIIEVAVGEPGDPDPGPWCWLHAWCERNDLVLSVRHAQRSSVSLDPPEPDATEFQPDAIAYRSQVRHVLFDHLVPHGYRPSMSLSSLSGAAPLHAFPYRARKDGSWGLLVTGGYRLADGEMSDASAGGPARGYDTEAFRVALDDPRPGQYEPSSPRMRPDLDAPSDMSPSVPGLRTAGTWAMTNWRIAGTSAAAASGTRALANLQYWQIYHDYVDPNDNKVVHAAESVWMGDGVIAPVPDPLARPTPTPSMDDAFRRARTRVR